LAAVAVVLHPTVELIQERQVVRAVVLTMQEVVVRHLLQPKASLVVLERLSLILAVAGEQVVLEEMLVRLQAKVEQVV
tara:strand:- start:428 stop:661 length:234 start_codon:yes stop_codon:yes gene_type:complete